MVNNITDSSSSFILEEKARLQEQGIIFWYDQNHKISDRFPLYHLQSKINCRNDDKKDCLIVELQAYKNHYPKKFIIGKCDSENWCSIIEPKFQNILINDIEKIVEFYGFDKDVYTIRNIDNNNYSIFKNDKEIFSHKMYFGAESVVEEANIVQNSPVFTFYDLKEWKDQNTPVVHRNIWYNGETINEKYLVEASSHLFAFKDKIGFVGEKDGGEFIFFNGQKISQDFDEIRTHGCCAIFAYPIEIDENGILFFLAKRGEKYFFTEINLNYYLK
jgi:hypothetical protein